MESLAIHGSGMGTCGHRLRIPARQRAKPLRSHTTVNGSVLSFLAATREMEDWEIHGSGMERSGLRWLISDQTLLSMRRWFSKEIALPSLEVFQHPTQPPIRACSAIPGSGTANIGPRDRTSDLVHVGDTRWRSTANEAESFSSADCPRSAQQSQLITFWVTPGNIPNVEPLFRLLLPRLRSPHKSRWSLLSSLHQQ